MKSNIEAMTVHMAHGEDWSHDQRFAPIPITVEPKTAETSIWQDF